MFFIFYVDTFKGLAQITLFFEIFFYSEDTDIAKHLYPLSDSLLFII